MAGHSHWAGIKHKKAANDAKRGRVWSKLARAIIVAAKTGGGDSSTNLALRYAIDKAKAANMPKDTIGKAVKRGTGELGGITYSEVMYEGYGPGGVAVMVDGLTDNRNRTGPEIRKIFERRGGSLGTTGCVNWMFKKKGLVTVDTDKADEDELMEIALTSGAEDMENTGEVYEITCEPAVFDDLKQQLSQNEIPIGTAEISMIPDNTVVVKETAAAEKILGLMNDLDDHEDVQNVYSNFDIPDAVVEKLE